MPTLLLDLLPSEERWQLGRVFVAVLATAVFETLGVASILPFMSVVVDGSAIEHYPLLRSVAGALGAVSWRGTVVVAAVLTGVMIALGNAAGACSLWLQARFAARTRLSLASQLLKAYLRQPYAFHTSRDSASLLKVIEQDVDNVVENMVSPLLNATSRALVVVALLALLAIQSPAVASGALVTLGGAYALVYRSVRMRQSRHGEQASKAAEIWQRSAYEALGGVKDIIVLDRADTVSARFSDAYRRYVDAESSNKVTAAMPRYFLETVAFACILALAVVLLLHGGAGAVAAIPALTLYAFAGYRLMPGLQQLFAEAVTLRYGAASLRTLHAEWMGAGVAAPARMQEPGDRIRFTNCISLRGVTFKYPGAARPAVEDITIDIGHGESLGLVGRTGAGKSTLADILLGLFEPASGTIAVDGIPLTSATMASWRRRVGYVAQHIFLANASLAENIAFGLNPDEVDHAAVNEAARLAQLDGFVASLPGGYATLVG